MGRIFSVMSGKGGVGKSTLSAALAEYYARMGNRVVLLDGDIGQRCADLMLNIQDRVVYDLGDVAEKNCELDQALLPHPSLSGLSLLAAPQMLTVSDVILCRQLQYHQIPVRQLFVCICFLYF